MSHVKDILLNQFLENVNDPSWYRPFTESVEGLTEEEAFWKPNEDCHSIAEIVQHIIYWNETWQTRFDKSDVKAVPSIENDKSFIISENQTFDNLRNRLIEVFYKMARFPD